MKKTIQRLLALVLVTMTIIGMTGCSAAASTGDVSGASAPAVTEPAAPSATSYGTVDWSTAAQGYISFTAKGQERMLVLQGPNTGVQAMMEVAKDETIKVALVDGTGKYQYAIANNTNGGKSYVIQYKNSFNVAKIDTDLDRYLVSNPYGDYENAPDATKTASDLWDKNKTQLENIQAICDWVDDNIKYDKNGKMGTIDVYVNPDKVIENKTGVCNEMAKTLIAMLRSQGVPAYYQGAPTPAAEPTPGSWHGSSSAPAPRTA